MKHKKEKYFTLNFISLSNQVQLTEDLHSEMLWPRYFKIKKYKEITRISKTHTYSNP